MLPGIGSSTIGKFKVRNSSCSNCGNKNTQEVSVSGKYLTLFFVPLFPLYKSLVSTCSHCKQIIRRKKFRQSTEIQYQENKILIKRPFWHWIGSIVFLTLLSTFIIIGTTANTKKDFRRNLLKADERLMTKSPSIKEDPISYEIKQLFDLQTNKNINASNFKYFTKIKEGKALILVQIPKLRKVEKKDRTETLSIIQSITKNHKNLIGKEVYIGIEGLVSMIIVKTPTYEINSRIASSSNLYPFYGAEPIPIDSIKKTITTKTKKPENN